MLGIEHRVLRWYNLCSSATSTRASQSGTGRVQSGIPVKVTRNFMDVKSNTTQPYTCVVCAVLCRTMHKGWYIDNCSQIYSIYGIPSLSRYRRIHIRCWQVAVCVTAQQIIRTYHCVERTFAFLSRLSLFGSPPWRGRTGYSSGVPSSCIFASIFLKVSDPSHRPSMLRSGNFE